MGQDGPWREAVLVREYPPRDHSRRGPRHQRRVWIRGRLMKLSLVVMTAGKSQGQAIPVTLAQFVIGRDPQCNLRPASAVISKRHCALLVQDGRVAIRDFNSTNGTFVN